MAARGVVIAGTDTAVGKTVVGCSLAHAAFRRSIRVGVSKPVESGCVEFEGRLTPFDAQLLRRASRADQSLDDVCPVRLENPLAPTVAAEMENVSLLADDLVSAAKKVLARHALAVVEPAGGLLSPLAEGLDSLELAKRLGLPILLVAPNRLGVINHVLLCERAINAAGVPLIGVVLCGVSPDADLSVETNHEQVARLASAKVFTPLPHRDFAAAEPWFGQEDVGEILDAVLNFTDK